MGTWRPTIICGSGNAGAAIVRNGRGEAGMMKLSLDYDEQILCDTCSTVLLDSEDTITFDVGELNTAIVKHIGDSPKCGDA